MIFQITKLYLFLFFGLAISVDPDEMSHNVAFHLDLYCSPELAYCLFVLMLYVQVDNY